MLATHERPLVGAHERISSIKLDDLASLQKPSFESRTARLPLPFPQPIEHAQHHQSDDHHDNARNERVEVELVGMAFARRDDGHRLRMKVALAFMIGAHEMERATHLQDGARSTILAERVDLRCRFVAHIHRDRRRIALRGKRDPPMPPRHAGTDAVADDLACYLHGLIVVIGIGAAEVDDGRVVDERAVGQLLRCLLYTSPSPRDRQKSRMPSSA